VTQNSGDQLRITAGRWAGRVEYVGRGYVVAIADGSEASDSLAGYRVFGIDRITEIGDAYFVGVASPRKQTAVARERAA
jgi:hypothetical protein